MDNQNLLQLLAWLDKTEMQLDELEQRGPDHFIGQKISEAKTRIDQVRRHPFAQEEVKALTKLLDAITAAESHPYA